ncbi:hypothetical protein [Aureibacillus halotolerans]|uniref:Uncharacterized protein n=1 Tax=Aureibacillus halotolerans TaxID=1508390 RepID=A0A4R6U7E6_9BACI|nr:hypothetical protein [Aureibacillus halotolerans]TDQ40833.1 hypothetical protein EV213_105179 [Aureibacillus halotolerans]
MGLREVSFSEETSVRSEHSEETLLYQEEHQDIVFHSRVVGEMSGLKYDVSWTIGRFQSMTIGAPEQLDRARFIDQQGSVLAEDEWERANVIQVALPYFQATYSLDDSAPVEIMTKMTVCAALNEQGGMQPIVPLAIAFQSSHFWDWDRVIFDEVVVGDVFEKAVRVLQLINTKHRHSVVRGSQNVIQSLGSRAI